jgi:tetratricopeptide (TPR) repeat protein
MRIGPYLVATLFLCSAQVLAAQDTPRAPIAPPPMTAPQTVAPAAAAAAAAPASAGAGELTAESRASAYLDFTMGHYYQLEYEVSSSSDDADQAIDYFKKAFELDPSSDVIGEQLAEMYFQSQRIRDAVLEAQSIIQRDPNNVSARRLLARIYVRTLGDLSDTSGSPPSSTKKSCAWIRRTPNPRCGSRASSGCRISPRMPRPRCAASCRAIRKTKVPSNN